MSEELITDDEIKKIKSNPVTLSLTRLIPVIPLNLESGYRVSYSIDILPSGKRYEHVAISKSDITSIDAAEQDCIAKRILGENYELLNIFFCKNVTHYRKPIE